VNLEPNRTGFEPDGQFVFVEYRAEEPQVPINALHRSSEAQVKREAAAHALVVGIQPSTLRN